MDKFALVRMYHPSGVSVSIPIDPDTSFSNDSAVNIFESIGKLISVGFLVNAPGLEEGETIEEVSFVSRRQGSDDTPIVAFYVANPKLVKKFLHVYLNTPEDIAEFEKACDLKLSSIPLFEGNQFLDKDKPAAKKYIVPLKNPIKLVWKVSEQWNKWKAEGGEGKEPHKRILVRYENGSVSSKSEPVEPTHQDGELLYEKSSAEFVKKIVSATNLDPKVFMPILNSVPEKKMNFSQAMQIINEKITNQESAGN